MLCKTNIMTVTLVIGKRVIKVANSLLVSSDLVKQLLLDFTNTGNDNIDVIVPAEYLVVIDYYLNFIYRGVSIEYLTLIGYTLDFTYCNIYGGKKD